MDISKIKELEAALCNHELGPGPNPKGSPAPKGSSASPASPAYLEGRHIYSITVEADYDGKTHATVHAQAKYVEELLRDNPEAITWRPDGKEFLYVKVNDITYVCIARSELVRNSPYLDEVPA